MPLLFALGGQVSPTGPAPSAVVSVVKRVNVDYWLVSGDRPLEFSVTADSTEHWLRVYTRLWWPAGVEGNREYRMSLWQGESERPLFFETGPSRGSQGPSGHKVGEWRSFFLELTEGTSKCRLTVSGGAAETVAVRFAFRAPRPWRQVRIGSLPRLTANMTGDSSASGRYHEIAAGASAPVTLEGPCRVRVRARLSFDPSMAGNQTFVVRVAEGSRELARRNLRVGRELAARYTESPGVIPSVERAFHFNLAPGRHELTVSIAGTVARSAAIALDYLPSERYED